jgi:hypothetical protein
VEVEEEEEEVDWRPGGRMGETVPRTSWIIRTQVSTADSAPEISTRKAVWSLLLWMYRRLTPDAVCHDKGNTGGRHQD